MKYISIIFLVFLLNSSTSMSKEVISQETWKDINKVLSSPVSCKDTWITIIKLRKELSELNYVNANKKWAELDG